MIHPIDGFRVRRIAADAPDGISGIEDDSPPAYDINGAGDVCKRFFGKHGVQCEE